MNSQPVFSRFIDGLEATGIEYVVVGSFAANVYGIARSTQDADIVVQADLERLTDLMKALGPEFRRDAQLGFESVTATSKTLVTHLPTKFIIEIFFLSEDPYDQERFRRRVRESPGDREAWLLSPEDVVVTKLRWFAAANRGKDKTDAVSVMGVQWKTLDWTYIETWCEKHNTLELLNRLRAELQAGLGK